LNIFSDSPGQHLAGGLDDFARRLDDPNPADDAATADPRLVRNALDDLTRPIDPVGSLSQVRE
jgi:hypothetical protein